MKVLAIESSCDDTSVAIVTSSREILALKTISDLKMHQEFGGVVPEIASRNHLYYMEGLIHEVLQESKIRLQDLDAIAVTGGPGLIGGVLVGCSIAKALSASASIPMIAINHLEGHALTCRLTDNIDYPFLLLLLSGGHTQIIAVKGLGDYNLIGSTIDDAVGECFDKVARMLSFEYPGGPKIEEMAKRGDENKFPLPHPLIKENNCNFSFSGLKTAVLRLTEKLNLEDEQVICDLCASFQKTVATILIDKLIKAEELYRSMIINPSKRLVIAGGVAANRYLYQSIELSMKAKLGYSIIAPPIKLCTDNAAMIAWAGIERFKRGESSDLSFHPKSIWPLNKINN